MGWVLAVSAVLNLALVVAWMDAHEGVRYYKRRLVIMTGSRDYWHLRASGKEKWSAKRKGA